jgi:hypothetical protein
MTSTWTPCFLPRANRRAEPRPERVFMPFGWLQGRYPPAALQQLGLDRRLIGACGE